MNVTRFFTSCLEFIITVLLISGLISAISCSRVPEACFQIDYSNSKQGLSASENPVRYFIAWKDTVHFHAQCSRDVDWYDWDTGDCPNGNTIIGVDAHRVYYSPGIYTVTLTVYHQGRKNVTQQQIEIRKK